MQSESNAEQKGSFFDFGFDSIGEKMEASFYWRERSAGAPFLSDIIRRRGSEGCFS
jgi:hypothetical protein